jgi:hypothetical protein
VVTSANFDSDYYFYELIPENFLQRRTSMHPRYVALALLLWVGLANAAQVTIFSENFESTLTGWSLSGDWQVGTPTLVGPATAYQGTRCAATAISGNYSASSSSIMATPPIQFPPTATSITMTYYEYYYTESSADYMYVEASINGGTTWSTVRAGLTGSNTAWTARTFDLTSYKNNNVQIRFRFTSDGSSQYPGWYIDNLTIAATVVDTANLPHIAVAPGSFKIGSKDSTTKAFTICNTGIGDTLQYSFSGTGVAPNILAWTYGATTTGSYANTVSSILQNIPNASITATATTDATTLSTLLRNANVFLIPVQDYSTPSSTIGTAFAPVLDSYVRSGGIVIVLGPYYSSTFLTYAGLDTLSYSNYTSSTLLTVTITNPTSPVFDGVTSLLTQSRTHYWTRTSAATILATYSSYTACSERAKGSGFIYLLGHDFYSTSNGAWGTVLANCIKSSSSNGLVTPDTASGWVKAGACKTVTLTFHREGLMPGNNVFLMRIRHNATLNTNPIAVPCTLAVDSTEIAHIAVAPGSFKINPADAPVKTLTICNTGTRDTLRYTVTGAPNILAWTYGTSSSTSGSYYYTVSSILSQLPNAKITATATTDAATLSTQLRSASIFLIPAQDYTSPASTIGAAFAPVLDSYVRSGGIVIVLAPSYESTFLTYAGLDTLSYSSTTSSSGYTVAISSPTHPMFDSVTSLSTQMYTSYWTPTSAATVLATYSSYAVCSQRTKGSGFIYMIGYSFYSANTTTWGKILANCIKKGSAGAGSLVSVDTASGVVRPGGCKTITVTYRRDGLTPGVSVIPLRISHNAVLEANPITVPCTLSVDSTTMTVTAPSMAVTLFTSDTALKTLTVQNTGSSQLNLSVVKTSMGMPSLLINEVSTYYGWFELLNVGNADVNIGGYRVVWTDNSASSGSYTIPANTIFRAHHGILFLEGTGTSSDTFFYTGTTINWTYTTDLSVALLNASGQGVDFFKTNLDPTNPPAGTAWSGPGVVRSGSVYNYYRMSIIDNNTAADWYASTSTSTTPYTLNPSQSYLTPVSYGYITARADSSTLGAVHTSLIRFRYDATQLMTGGVFIDTFQIIHNAKNIKSPVTVICTMTVRSNIPSLIPYKPDPTIERKPKLAWHPVASATAYMVEVAQVSTFSTLLFIQQTADTTFASLTNLPIGDIFWRVRCDLNPKPSLPDHFYIQNDSIPVLIPITPDTITQQSGLTFRWHRSIGASNYKIQLTRIDTFPQVAVIITYATDTFYTDAAQITKGRYMWTIAASFDFNRPSYPDTFTVLAPIAVIAKASRELPKTYALNAGNSGGFLRITAAIPKQEAGVSLAASIDLFDVRGKLVRKVYAGALVPGYHQFTIVNHDIAGGIYYCRFRAGNFQKLAPVYMKK